MYIIFGLGFLGCIFFEKTRSGCYENYHIIQSNERAIRKYIFSKCLYKIFFFGIYRSGCYENYHIIQSKERAIRKYIFLKLLYKNFFLKFTDRNVMKIITLYKVRNELLENTYL